MPQASLWDKLYVISYKLIFNSSSCEMLALWNPTKVGAKQFHRASKIISQGQYINYYIGFSNKV